MPTQNKLHIRQARIRGSGTRNVNVGTLNIASATKTRGGPKGPESISNPLKQLESALNSPEALSLPKLRNHSSTTASSNLKQEQHEGESSERRSRSGNPAITPNQTYRRRGRPRKQTIPNSSRNTTDKEVESTEHSSYSEDDLETPALDKDYETADFNHHDFSEVFENDVADNTVAAASSRNKRKSPSQLTRPKSLERTKSQRAREKLSTNRSSNEHKSKAAKQSNLTKKENTDIGNDLPNETALSRRARRQPRISYSTENYDHDSDHDSDHDDDKDKPDAMSLKQKTRVKRNLELSEDEAFESISSIPRRRSSAKRVKHNPRSSDEFENDPSESIVVKQNDEEENSIPDESKQRQHTQEKEHKLQRRTQARSHNSILSKANAPSVLKNTFYSTHNETSAHKAPVKYKEAKPLLSLKSLISLPARGVNKRDEPAIPLSKKKVNEKQKALLIDVSRLITNSTSDRRMRINTLDVLKQLIQNNEPKVHKNKFLDERTIYDDFKSYLLYQLDNIVDTSSSIRDLSSDILNTQRKKNEMRKKIYDLKESHSKVGNDLNELRSHYNESRSHYEYFNDMTNQMSNLNKELSQRGQVSKESGSDTTVPVTDAIIDQQLSHLGKIINPHSGISKKLLLINQKLSEVDYELS